MKEKVLLSLSGGMDSTTLLAWLLNQGYDVYPVHFTYGSKHNDKEIKAIEKIVDYYGLTGKLKGIKFNLHEIFKSSLLSNGGDVPEGYYEQENMKQTIVPFRNGIFISLLTGYAISNDIYRIALAVHAGDHFIYPDCREDFIKSMNKSIQLGTDSYIDLLTPFINLSKSQICRIGLNLNVPYQYTWTCYKGRDKACGVCGACVERLESFYLNFEIDPIEYEDRSKWKEFVLVNMQQKISQKIMNRS